MTELPAAHNHGWIYRERVAPEGEGLAVSAYLALRHAHSSRQQWRDRVAAGELVHNGRVLLCDACLRRGDRLAWHRPAWIEPAVPAAWSVLHDDGDLHVITKPSGLPVLPAGGFLEHTLLRLLEHRHAADPAGMPRPVHRLGRFTSGVLVCARRPASRAWLSQRLRESTAAAAAAVHGGAAEAPCRKLYRALLEPGRLPLLPGDSLELNSAIGRRPHPRLGRIWCAADPEDPTALAARSRLTLLERRADADLVEVLIASGRPHQIRIHCAAAGAPLLGDPLYGDGGLARPGAVPGDGGYRLHALRLQIERPDGTTLALIAPPPPELCLTAATRQTVRR